MKKLTKFEQFATLLAAACCVAAIVLSLGAGLPDSAVYTSGRPEGGEVRTGSYPPESGADSQSEPAAAGGKININTATCAEMTDSGHIDPETARRIVAYRSIAGPFGSIDELRGVDGISGETFSRIAPYITAGN